MNSKKENNQNNKPNITCKEDTASQNVSDSIGISFDNTPSLKEREKVNNKLKIALDDRKNTFVNIKNIDSVIDKITNKENPDLKGLVIFEELDVNNLARKLNDNGIDFDLSLPLIMTKKHIYSDILANGALKNANYHNLGKQIFLDAIYRINNPYIIFKNAKSIVVGVDVIDNHNNRIIIPFMLKTTVNNINIEANMILTLYGKRNFEKYVSSKEIIYKKGSIAQSNSVVDASYTNNISPQEENVNFLLNNENIIKIDLSTNLQKEFETLHSIQSKQKFVREFLYSNFVGKSFTMPDEIMVKASRTDINHYTKQFDENRYKADLQIDKIIKKSIFNIEIDVRHKRFDRFRYYDFSVNINGEIFDGRLNIGEMKNRPKDYRLYDIKPFIKKESVNAVSSLEVRTSSTNSSKNNISSKNRKINIKNDNKK